MGYIKKIMQIGSGINSIETEEVFGITGEFDMDALCGTLEFQLPYLQKTNNLPTNSVDITKLKKNDSVKLYFKEFTSDPGKVTPADLVLIFDGYIDNIHLNKSKTDIPYTFKALGTIGLANEKNVQFKVESYGDMTETVIRMIELANMSSYITIQSDLTSGVLFPKVEGEKSLKGLLMKLREKYAVIIHQTGDGILRLFTPQTLLSNSTTIAWQFDLKLGNIFNIDYGDITSDINGAVVLGYPPSVGIAVDAVAIQNQGGTIPNDVRYQSFENRDLNGDEACEEVARNKLLEIERNHSLSFQTKFVPEFAVGQAFQLKDYDRFTGNEVFLMKKYAFTIDKQDVSCIVTGFTHSLTLLPSQIVLSNTGVADIDVIGLRTKESDISNWNGGAF